MKARYQKQPGNATLRLFIPLAIQFNFEVRASAEWFVRRFAIYFANHPISYPIVPGPDVDLPIPNDEATLVDDTSGRNIAACSPLGLLFYRLYRRGLLRAGLLLAILLILGFWHLPVAHAAPQSQSNPGTSPQLYLLPRDAANNNVVVDTHLVTLHVIDDPAGLQLQVNAIYKLHNPADSGVTLPLVLFPGGDQSLGGFQNLSLTQDDKPLLLQSGDGGGYLSQIAMDAGDHTTLVLQYQVSLGSQSLATVRYAPSILNGWAGNISLRVELQLPNTIPADSWIEITPADWRYSVDTDPNTLNVRWLYDFSAPDDPLILRFITPHVWAELQAAQSAATGSAAVTAFVKLGDLYRDLMQVAPNDSVRARFYAQAIAAYSAGETSQAFALASPNEKAGLHAGLADLYRRQLVSAPSSEQGQYADQMVAEIVQALAVLPADDSRVAELHQWQTDGWQLQLATERSQRNWPAALAIVDKLAQLPANVIDPAVVAEDRRFILLQQALELMEQGNRVAAVAVAGDQISSTALLPPPQAASLFSGWQLTLTVAPDAMRLVAFGLTEPDHHAEAVSGLKEVVELWKKGVGSDPYQFDVQEIPVEVSLESGVRLQIDFPAGGNGFELAHMLPPRVDYALLRSLLTQLSPTIKRTTGVMWEQVEMRQPLTLASAVNEWNGVAAGLETQAAAFDAQGKEFDPNQASSVEAALTAQLQAVNYRTTAADWRHLARQSSLLINFGINDPIFTRIKGETPSRAWTITAVSPSQTFVFQTQVLSVNRVLMGAALAFVLLIAVAAVLWGLL